MKISTVYHTGPVTALCCHDNTILAGIGSFLHVYLVSDGSSKLSEKVLHGRNVHGIRPEYSSSETRICIFGQKCIRLLTYNPATFQVKPLTEPVEFPDWIWDVTWLKDDPSVLCLALGHNVVVTYDVASQRVVDSAHCQEKCIIYCAKFITNHSRKDLILAAGTVFNQVVLWSPLGRLDEDGRRQVIHRLTGHQGVIFSIDYEPVSQRICTASDDRSLILYQVKFTARGREGQQPMTGPCLGDWETMDCSLIHVLYGHSARVWDVRLLTNVFVSVGEDSTCCVWSYDGHVIRKFRGHKGKSIWSLAVDKGEHSIVTGGGDHSIRLWHLQQGQDGADSGSLETTTIVPLQTVSEDFPRSTQMLGINSLLVLTNMGKLLLYSHTTQTASQLMADQQFASYSVMEVSPNGSIIPVGNIHGTVRLFSCSAGQWADVFVSDVSLYEGRVFSVHWLDETTLLTTGPDGLIRVCHVNVNEVARTISCDVTFDLDLPPSKHRWVSAVAYGPDSGWVVCGDRMGSIYLYCVKGERQNRKPLQAFPKIHGKVGVTSVCCHGNQVYTTGRDGLYRVFAWTDQQELQLLNSNRVYKGFEWLEKLVIEEEDIRIHGFHSNMFLVWSVQSNQKLFEVECGGGHRAWGFRCHGNRAQFVFIKSREVVLKDVEIRASQTVVKESLHGREMCDAKRVCTTNSNRADVCDILVTCSEDTNICVSALTYTNGSPKLRVLQTLSCHISSVRCLSICPSSLPSTKAGIKKSLIFSGGGRAQLRVSRLTVDCQETSDDFQQAHMEAFRIEKEGTGIQLKHARTTGSCDSNVHAKNRDDTQNEKEILTHGSVSKGDKTTLSEKDLGNKRTDALKHSENIDCKNTDSSDYYDDTRHTNTMSNSLSKGCNPQIPSDSPIKGCTPQCNVESLAVIQLGQSGRRPKKPWRHQEEYSDPETRILDTSVVVGQDLGGAVPQQLCLLSAACSDGLVRFFVFDEESRDIVELCSSSHHDHCVLKTCHLIIERSRNGDTLTRDPMANDHVSSQNSQLILDNNACLTETAVRDDFKCDDSITTQNDDIIKKIGDVNTTSDDATAKDKSTIESCDLGVSNVNIQNGDATAKAEHNIKGPAVNEIQDNCNTLINSRCDHVIFLTASTDGSVAFWDATDLFEKYICDSIDTSLSDNKSKTCVGEIHQNSGLGVVTVQSINASKKGGLEKGPETFSSRGNYREPNKVVKGEEEGLQKVGSLKEGVAEGSPGPWKEETDEGKSCPGKEGAPEGSFGPIFTLRLHQSGINSMHISKLTDGQYMLVTGGDDNAIKVTIVAMDTTKGQVEVKVAARGGDDFAHAAQITGVWTLTPTRILTVSIDQRLCIWSVARDQQQIHLIMLECRFVDVMDIANIDVWKRGSGYRVLLSGEGLQMLDIDTHTVNQTQSQ